jgi:hypothetical protein
MLASLYTREGITIRQRCSSVRRTIILKGHFGIRVNLWTRISLWGYVNAEAIRCSVVAAMDCLLSLNSKSLKLRVTTCVGSTQTMSEDMKIISADNASFKIHRSPNRASEAPI